MHGGVLVVLQPMQWLECACGHTLDDDNPSDMCCNRGTSLVGSRYEDTAEGGYSSCVRQIRVLRCKEASPQT
jgi:hypothetical protein